MCLSETKLTEAIQINIDDNNYYIMWRKNRKGEKDDMIIMIKSRIKVIDLVHGKGKTELISAQIITRYSEKKSGCIPLPKPIQADKRRTRKNN